MATETNLWDQMEWLVQHSEGVVGLKMDGSVMPWREVADLYASELRVFLEGQGDSDGE